jgi:hypothetical protein
MSYASYPIVGRIREKVTGRVKEKVTGREKEKGLDKRKNWDWTSSWPNTHGRCSLLDIFLKYGC